MLFIPLSDDNPLRFVRYQWVTILLVAVNVIAYGLQLSGLLTEAVSSLSIVPAEFVHAPGLWENGRGAFDTLAIPKVLTLFTYMFLHIDVLHLASNMMFLWVFGDNVEDAMGHVRYLVFYLLCGMVAGLAQVLMEPHSQSPLLGASGAVAGTIAAYLILHPRVLVWVLAFRVLPLRITAAWILGVWVITQISMVLIGRGQHVAWWAHIGGAAAGTALIPFMRRATIPLFDRGAKSIDKGRDAWWREHQAAIFHRGLWRLARPWRTVVSLWRYLRAFASKHARAAQALLQRGAQRWERAPTPRLEPSSSPRVNGRSPDILRFEERGANFALVRIKSDGSRAEIELTGANVVHLGLMAPGFARAVLTDRVGQQPGLAAQFMRFKTMNAGLRFIELLVAILDRGGPRLDFPSTERKARRLAATLVAHADRMAHRVTADDRSN